MKPYSIAFLRDTILELILNDYSFGLTIVGMKTTWTAKSLPPISSTWRIWSLRASLLKWGSPPLLFSDLILQILAIF